MKKFYTMLTALAFSALAFNASAQAPTATVVNGLYGAYAANVDQFSLQYLVNGEAQSLSFVDPLVGYKQVPNYETMQYDEVPYYYIYVDLLTPDNNIYKVEAQISSLAGDLMPLSNEGTRAEESDNALILYAGYAWQPDPDDPEEKIYIEFQYGEEYKIEIPGGAINVGSLRNENQVIPFTCVEIAYLYDYQYDPVPSYYRDADILYSQESLENLKITFDDQIQPNVGNITYTNSNTEVPEILDAQYIKYEGNSIILDLSNLSQGSYALEIPTGFVVIGGAYLNGSNICTYNIWNGLQNGQLIQGPSGSVTSITDIELYYGTEISPAVNQFPAINVYRYYVDPDNVAFQIPASNITIKNVSYDSKEVSVLYLDLTSIPQFQDFIETTLYIEIPEGIVKDGNGALNPRQEISFSLQNLTTADYSIDDNGEGYVSILWEDAEYVSYTYGNQEVYVVSPDGTKEYLYYDDQVYVGFSYAERPDGTLIFLYPLEIDLYSILDQEGDYELVIPEGYVGITVPETYIEDGMEEFGYSYGLNSEIKYKFSYADGKTSGIQAITNSSAKIEMNGIYNLQGVKVGNDSSDLNNLPGGIYIINGKKVLIRK